jgi:hypothetical protein
MKQLKRSLLMLSLSPGIWGVSCSQLSASLPREEDQGSNLEKEVRASHSNTVEPLTLSVLSTPIEQTIENPPSHVQGVIQHDNPPLFSFEEFKERCPGYHYKRVPIGDDLYLCGINTNVQYESFLTFESHKVERENSRISSGEEFVESVIEAAESPEDTQFEVVRVLRKKAQKHYVVLGAILLGRRADDPKTILIEKFHTRASIDTKRSFILEGFFKAFPAQIPPLSSYLFSFRCASLAPQYLQEEVMMFLKNGFRVEEVYLKGDYDKNILVEGATYFNEFETKYKFLPHVSYTFVKSESHK